MGKDRNDISSTTKFPDNSEAGNVFFALFGAVAVVGVLGAGIMATMRGPLSTMVEVNRREQAKAEARVAANLVLVRSASQDLEVDCEGGTDDGFVEGLANNGAITGFTGGGELPVIGATTTDPWGNPYAYCAWDHGPAALDYSGCGTVLAGNSSTSNLAIAIISAGPDGVFQTSCVADNSGTNDYIEPDGGGGDDIIEPMTYSQAISSTGGLWNIKSGDPSVAEIAKNIEVTGTGNFSGAVEVGSSVKAATSVITDAIVPIDPLSQDYVAFTGGIKIGDVSVSGCTAAGHIGMLRVNGGILQICQGVAGWQAAGSKWKDGTAGKIYYDTANVGVGSVTDPARALDVGGTFGATGATTLGSTLSVGDTLNVTGAGTFNSTLAVAGNFTVNTDKFTINATNGDTSAAGVIDTDAYYQIDGNTVVRSDTTMANSILLGKDAGASVSGDKNTILGAGAGGTLAGGEGNIVIGAGSSALAAPDVPAAATDHYLNIGNILHGDLANKRLGIGFADDYDVSGFNDTLEVNGNTDITGDLAVSGTSTFGTTVTINATGDIDASGTIEAGDYTWNGIDFTPGSCNEVTEKTVWNAVTGWKCVADTAGGGGAGGAINFTDLNDVPGTYAGGDAGKIVVVNGTEDGLEFVSATSLTDAGKWEDTLVAETDDIRRNKADGDVLIGAASSAAVGIDANASSDLYVEGLVKTNSRVLVPYGSAAAPSYVFTSSPTTGIYAGAADTISFATAGTARAHILSNGDVGIGTGTVPTGVGASGQDLLMAVNGPLGATHYCDELGEDCFTAADFATAGAQVFTDLTDVPGTYAGSASKFVRVKSTEDGLEFTDQIIESVTGEPAPTGLYLDDITDVDTTGVADGDVLVYNAGTWEITAGSGLGSATNPAGADREIQFNDNGVFGASSTFKLISDGDLLLTGTHTGTASVPVSGAGTRMFFDTQKSAFRAGYVNGTQWDNGNIGSYSTAMGASNIASYNYAVALGQQNTSSGSASIALGFTNTATGSGASGATAIGYNNYSMGDGSMALGANNSVTNHAGFAIGAYNNSDGSNMALGFYADVTGGGSIAIGASTVNPATDPVISGAQSFGVFMGNHSGVDFSAANTAGFFGGKMVIDPAVPATQITARGVLDLGAATDALVLPSGTDAQRPGTPAGGMFRYNTDATPKDVIEYYDAESAAWIQVPTSVAGGAVLSGITAAEAANTIGSGDYAQAWNWTLTTAAKSAMTFGETTAATNGAGAQSVVKMATLASSTAMPLWIENAGDALSFRVDDEASDTTPFAIDAAGNVGIGTASPDTPLHVVGGNANGQYVSTIEVANQDAEYLKLKNSSGDTVGEIMSSWNSPAIRLKDSSGTFHRVGLYAWGQQGPHVYIKPDNTMDNTHSAYKSAIHIELTNNWENGISFGDGSTNKSAAITWYDINGGADGTGGLRFKTAADGTSNLQTQMQIDNNGLVSFPTTGAITLPSGTDAQRPGTPAGGMFRYNTDATPKDVIEYYDAESASWIQVPTAVAGGAVLSGITAAAAANTIGSGDYAQVWNWTLTTAAKSAMTFGETAAATNGAGAQSVVKMATLASSTAMPLWIENAGDALSFRVDDAASDTTPFAIDAAGNVGIGTATPRTSLDIVATDALVLPSGTTAQQPGSPAGGMIRYNTTATPNDKVEYYDAESTSWIQLGSGGGGSSKWSDGVDANDIYYSSGFVGIGTTDPDVPLQIHGGNADGEYLATLQLNNQHAEYLQLKNASGTKVFDFWSSWNQPYFQMNDSAGTGRVWLTTGGAAGPHFSATTSSNKSDGTDSSGFGLRIGYPDNMENGIAFGDGTASSLPSSAITGYDTNPGSFSNHGGLRLKTGDGYNPVTRMQIDPNGIVRFTSTGAIVLPSGTDAQRPGTPAGGMFRYNTDATPNDKIEYYDAESAGWVQLASGAIPAGNDTEIQFNDGGALGSDTALVWNKTSNYLGIGIAPSVALDVSGDIEYTGTITDVSDMRLKKDIKPLGAMLDKIGQVKTYSFMMKDDEQGRTEFGVMAQELENIFPELVHTAQDEMGTKSVNYVGLIAPIIEATKELKAENESLRAEIAAMKTQNTRTEETLASLSRQVELLNEIAGEKVGKASMQPLVIYGLGLLCGLLAALGSALVIARRKSC